MIALLFVLALLAGVTTACNPAVTEAPTAPGPTARPKATATATATARRSPRRSTASPNRPNIVFVLTDDLSKNLVRCMPHVLATQRHGVSFPNYVVTDSLCCPSRSSILTGEYPHNTGIYTNSPPFGGYAEFRQRGEEHSTFAVALHNAGYRTALMGKYLNGYRPRSSGPTSGAPPGWDEWDGVGNGYREYNYRIAHNRTTRFHDHQPGDYLTTVLQHRATAFIGSAAATGRPFMLEVATFTPHRPYVPAPRDTAAFPGLRAPRTAAFNRLPAHAPGWLTGRPRLTPKQVAAIDAAYRLRAQDVLSVDRLIGSIEAALTKAGVARKTVVVFSSDNGYHMGEYRLEPGKMTAFDTDINVPLVVTGPHIPAGRTNHSLVQNIDLCPTFEALAGVRPRPRVDGTSIVPLLHYPRTNLGLNTALVEHRGPDRDLADPDYAGRASGNPPTYAAIRTRTYTYVQYMNGQAEYYNRSKDPAELHNIVGRLSLPRRAHLQQVLFGLTQCVGGLACTVARKAT